MRVVVCVKHVPDVDSDRRIEGGRIVRGEDDVLNELDEYAIEEAVSLVENHGGEVIAVTMGPEDAEDALVRALQMGADRALLVNDDALAGADALGTASILAALVRMVGKEDPVDLVFTGMTSLDGMTSMVAPAMATELAWPLLDLATNVEVDTDPPMSVTVRRQSDGYVDTLRASAPAVVSVSDEINEPRYPSFKTMRAARSKPIDEVALEDLQPWISANAKFASIRVTDADVKERGEGLYITDSGDGGLRLADFIIEQVKE